MFLKNLIPTVSHNQLVDHDRGSGQVTTPQKNVLNVYSQAGVAATVYPALKTVPVVVSFY